MFWMLTNIEYFEEIIHKIDNLTEITKMLNYLDGIETISSIIVNIIVALGGVLGLLYYRKLREKQKNAVFSYLTQLKVRSETLYALYITYEQQIMECFIPETKRRRDLDSTSSFIDKIIDEFSQCAAETLEFLKNSNEQMPASKEWSEEYDILIEFLLDAKHLSMGTYYKWISDDDKEQRKTYAARHKNNLKKILEDITEKQNENISKMFSKQC